MMDAGVEIGLLQRRYRLPAVEPLTRRRLDGLTETLLRDRLPEVLERLGIRPEAAACLRELRLDLTYRPGMGEAECLEAWTEHLTRDLAAALERAAPDDVIRYRSRVEAFVDAALALASGRLERGWAWKALGITAADHRATPTRLASQWRAQLAGAPELPAVLRRLIRTDAVAPMLARGLLRRRDLADLGRAHLRALGREGALETPVARGLHRLETEAGTPTGTGGGAQRGTRGGEDRVVAVNRAARVLRNSRILKTIKGEPVPDEAMALAVLPILEVEPGLLAEPVASLGPLLRAIAGEILPAAAPEDLHKAVGKPAADLVVPFRSKAPRRDAAPTLASEPSGTKKITSATKATTHALNEPEADGTGSRAEPSRNSGEEGAAGSAPLPPAPFHESTAPETLCSEAGGLFILINAMKRFGTVERLLADPALADRPLERTLEDFALAAAPVPLRDPALAVFSDRAPDDPPWRVQDGPPDSEEATALAREVESLRDGLADLLPDRNRNELLSWVVLREARIEISSGWITTTLPLACVDTGLRRAGLDLHPDYVPWLGCVVRIDYEATP